MDFFKIFTKKAANVATKMYGANYYFNQIVKCR